VVAFVASTVLTAAALNSAFNALTINAQTGTTYTLVLTDAGGLCTLSNASAITLTVPTNASVAFPTGSIVSLLNLGAGTVTVTPAGGVTVNGPTMLIGTNESASLIKTATNTWSLVRGGLPKASASGTTGSPTTDTVSRPGKTIYTFTGAGSITLSEGAVQALVVGAGGGGSGGLSGICFGGPGAGGECVEQTVYLSAGTYSITVGTGGVGGAQDGSTGTKGGNSTFGSIIMGGGRGGTTGAVGGSNGPFTGGNGSGTYAGGGAGSTADGSNSGGGSGGAAGAGLSSSITGSAVTYGRGGAATGVAATAQTANIGEGGDGVGGGGSGQAGSGGVVIIVVG
jgi:hypothetical protein